MSERARCSSIAFWVGAFLVATSAQAITISTRFVGDPGNADDTTGGIDTGAVAYSYNIGTYDVTNAQYAAFLNAVDPTGANLLQLYSSSMATGSQGGISWNGASYVVNSGYANKPVVYVNWYSTLRFANWLTNGQGGGDTETGVYTLSGLTSLAADPVEHSTLIGTGTKWFLPTEREWHKAAFYKGGSTNAGYWAYPFGSDTEPTVNQISANDPNSGNFYNGVYATTQLPSSTYDSSLVYLTDVGAYSQAVSPYGLYDMGGNVFQWTETHWYGANYRLRGGDWHYFANGLASSYRPDDPATLTDFDIGFRVANVAGVVPEPGSIVLLMSGTIGLLPFRRGKRLRDFAKR